MKKYIKASLANLILLLTLVSCGTTEEGPVENSTLQENKDERLFITNAQFDKSGMSLGNIEQKEFPTIVSATGMIDVPPENRAVVTATMGGYIKTIPFLIGDKLKKGQPIATIENPEFIALQQSYMEVKENLSYLESEYERQKTMVEENITSQKSFLQAESGFKTAKARYNGLRKQLTLLNISPASVENGKITSIVTVYAPITGSVTKVNVSRGTYVSPSMSIMEIIDNEHIHLELSIFEKDIMKLKKEQEINFTVPESSSEVFKASVHLIGTAIEENRTIKVHGHLKDEEQANFLTGMFVEADIVTSSAFAKALPETAVTT